MVHCHRSASVAPQSGGRDRRDQADLDEGIDRAGTAALVRSERILSASNRRGWCIRMSKSFARERYLRTPGRVDLKRRSVAFGGGLIAFGASAASISNAVAAVDCPGADIKAEEEAVRRAEEEFASALTSGDVDNVVRSLAQDIVLITRYTDPARPGQPLHAAGIETARALNTRFLSRARNLVASITPTNIAVARSGDLAYVIGDFEFRFELVGHGRMIVRGRNLHIFKKVNGEWKIAVEAAMDAATEKNN